MELAVRVVLEQIRHDADALDREALAVGPFARLDANALAARVGKTRGALSNLFGSQAALQAETMALALDAAELIDAIELPDPATFPDAEAWVDRLFADAAARGPRHGAEPGADYAFLWTLWLAAVPYGLWSERIAGPSMAEHAQWVRRLEGAFTGALAHFGMALAEGTTALELANAAADLIEGTWLNQCLTDPEPVAAGLRRAGLMLWRGAIA